mmetsp:Transcript_75767/g.190546  ORF Transcript_75767/g.190546 Transcript_75767/m.190546 type:complete len:218 (-) Transcript_75767:279-932(-)
MVPSERLLSPASSRLILLEGSAAHSRSIPASLTFVSSMCSSSRAVSLRTSTRASIVASPICVLSRCRVLILVCGSTFISSVAPASLMPFLPSTSVVNDDPRSACASAGICASVRLLSPTSNSDRPTCSGSIGSTGLMSVRRFPSKNNSSTCTALARAEARRGRASSGSSLSPKSYFTSEAGILSQNSAQAATGMPGLLETPTPLICVGATSDANRVS